MGLVGHVVHQRLCASPGVHIRGRHSQTKCEGFNYSGGAHLIGGKYTLTVDDPDGLRCGSVYYGPTALTHDVYSWDATTLAGTLVSTFDAGCDGAPGALTHSISQARP